MECVEAFLLSISDRLRKEPANSKMLSLEMLSLPSEAFFTSGLIYLLTKIVGPFTMCYWIELMTRSMNLSVTSLSFPLAPEKAKPLCLYDEILGVLISETFCRTYCISSISACIYLSRMLSMALSRIRNPYSMIRKDGIIRTRLNHC